MVGVRHVGIGRREHRVGTGSSERDDELRQPDVLRVPAKAGLSSDLRLLCRRQLAQPGDRQLVRGSQLVGLDFGFPAGAGAQALDPSLPANDCLEVRRDGLLEFSAVAVADEIGPAICAAGVSSHFGLARLDPELDPRRLKKL